jgi:hypothetical protein
MSFSADKVVDPRTLVPKDAPMVVVIGAMAHGSVSTFALDHYLDCILRISGVLSARSLCHRTQTRKILQPIQ